MDRKVGGRMKGKKLGSATLPHTWPKPIFAFKGSLGHLPVEAQPYVFVSRRNPLTGQYKIVPDMLYPIQANRQPALRHEVLEDEYRAFHNAILNQLLLKNKLASDVQWRMHASEEMLKASVDVNFLLWSGRIGEMKDHLPQLLAYNPGVLPPPGYMYQKFRHSMKGPIPGRSNEVRLRRPPIVAIRSPFQNVVELCTRHYRDDVKYFDSAVIGQPRREEIRIYNEPEAVSSLAVEADFGRPLSERAMPVDVTSKKTSHQVSGNGF